MVYRKFSKFLKKRRFSRRKSYRRRRVPRTYVKVARKIAKKQVEKGFELRSIRHDLRTTFSSGIGTTWRILEVAPNGGGDTGSWNGHVGRSYCPRAFFTKNMLLFAGASGTTGIDDYYNVMRIMFLETDGFEGSTADLQVKMENVDVNNIASNKVPFAALPRFVKVHYDKSYILKTLGDPDGAGYVPIPRRANLFVRLSGKSIISANTPVVYNRRFFLCVVSDSSVNPSPSILNGNAFFTYRDDA